MLVIPGPPLQNKLWDILVRHRAYPIAVTADIQKAFLQIHIRECEQDDASTLHWRKSEHEKLEILRFIRTLFGLAPSPFLLGGIIEAHLEASEEQEPELVAELRCSLNVDDLLTGGRNRVRPNSVKRKPFKYSATKRSNSTSGIPTPNY